MVLGGEEGWGGRCLVPTSVMSYRLIQMLLFMFVFLPQVDFQTPGDGQGKIRPPRSHGHTEIQGIDYMVALTNTFSCLCLF